MKTKTKQKPNITTLINSPMFETLKNLPAIISDEEKTKFISSEFQKHQAKMKALCDHFEAVLAELNADDTSPERKDKLKKQAKEMKELLENYKAEGKVLQAHQQNLTNKVMQPIYGKIEMHELTELTKSNQLSKYLKQKDSTQRTVEMLQDQFTAAHRASMSLLARFYEDGINESTMRMVTKLMGSCNMAAQTIQKLQTGGQQKIIVQHQNVQVNGGQAVVANELIASKEGLGDGDRK